MGKRDRFKHPVAQRFFCTKCGLCCGDTNEKRRHILLLKKEADEIAEAVSQPISAFAKRIKGKAPYAYEIRKTNEIGACVFLQNNKCLIYPFRPLVCRFYPFELKNAADQEYEFLCTKECPGINKGKILGTNYYAQLFKIAQARLSPDKARQRKHNDGYSLPKTSAFSKI
jgi:Fe-S-cluster containining protein